MELSDENQQAFLSWTEDPCYDLEDVSPELQQIEIYQKGEWACKSLKEDSDELAQYKEVAKRIKNFFLD